MKKILFIVLMCPLLVKAQMGREENSFIHYDTGIRWTQNMNWQEIKAEAKAQNKFIFVDCNATWCRPCKIMDRDVFTNDSIGNLINNKFVAVKVQVDTGKNDDATTRNLYATAREFENRYKISGVPSFLFFSPEGEIVHKEVGGKQVNEFASLVQEAMDPAMQLYTLIQRGNEGKLDFNILQLLIKKLRLLGEKDLEIHLARLYMKKYIESLPETLYASRSNLLFMADHQQMLTYADRIYDLCRERPVLVDSVSELPELANKLVKNIIIFKDVLPPIQIAKKNNKEPDWNAIRDVVSQKTDHGKTENILLDAQLYWYATLKNWPKYSQYYFIRASQTDFSKVRSKEELIVQLNTVAWDLFQYSENKEHLQKALVWINEAIELKSQEDPGLLDTKANLLYKLGRKKQAIAIQEKAVLLMKDSRNTEIHIALDKMKRGVPTWNQR